MDAAPPSVVLGYQAKGRNYSGFEVLLHPGEGEIVDEFGGDNVWTFDGMIGRGPWARRVLAAHKAAVGEDSAAELGEAPRTTSEEQLPGFYIERGRGRGERERSRIEDRESGGCVRPLRWKVAVR